jgi:outer membrane receptor protein involved in Fe transport
MHMICGVSIAAIMGMSGFCASAQTTAAPAQSAAPTQSGDIVVTANRRSETVQKANQSITAISGAELQAKGVVSVEQLAGEVPGISQKNEGPGQTEYEMRGMSSSGGSSPTVGFYIDDVALTAPASSDINKPAVSPDLYDLNRVEVLRGPQGTLYGSSSMGGTIRLITNQPDPHKFGASVQATGSGTDGGGFNYGLSGMVNIPIVTDTLAVRIVGTDSRNSGWIDRDVDTNFPLPASDGTRGDILAAPVSTVHKNANWNRTQGIRASVLWQPTDNLTVTPSVMYQALKLGGQNVADVPPGTSHETHYQPFDVAEPSSDKFLLATLPIKYRLGSVQIDAITGYYHRKNIVQQENGEDVQDFLSFDFGMPMTFDQVGQVNPHNTSLDKQFTQELRISSTGDGPFQWLAGAYYQNFNSNFIISSNDADSYIQNLIVNNPAFGALLNPLSAKNWFHIQYHNKTKQYAGFGEVSYKLGALKFTAGLRYYSYDTSLATHQYGILVTGTDEDAATNALAKGHASGFIPRINVSYEPTSDLTLYAQAAKGFRPGSALPPPLASCGGGLPTSYSPDSVWSYEAGEKARLFNRRVTLNASGYYENWKNIQQQIADNACGYDYTSNAGTAHIYGAEAELSVHVTSELLLSTAVGYTHAALASVPAGASFSVGDRIQSVPKWTNTANLVYTHRLTDDYNVVFRATDEYTGNQQVVVNSLDTVPSHNFVNLRVGVTSKNGMSAWLFANNVTNKDTILNVGDPLSVFNPSYLRAIVPQPRTIGVELNYSF